MKNPEVRQFGLKIAIIMGVVCILVAIPMAYLEKPMPIVNVSIPAGLIFLVVGLILFGVALSGPTRQEQQWWKSKWIWVVVIIISAAAVFGIIQPFVWRGIYGQYPPRGTIDLSTLLTIVLTLLAIGVAVFGGGIYYILSRRIEERAKTAAYDEIMRGSARLMTHIGYVFWGKYKRRKEETQYLDLAIEVTGYGLGYMSRLPEKKRENQRLLCTIKNNLAYYLATRNDPADKELAKQYAEYIRTKIQTFPDEKQRWLDTFNFVAQQYPNPKHQG